MKTENKEVEKKNGHPGWKCSNGQTLCWQQGHTVPLFEGELKEVQYWKEAQRKDGSNITRTTAHCKKEPYQTSEKEAK